MSASKLMLAMCLFTDVVSSDSTSPSDVQVRFGSYGSYEVLSDCFGDAGLSDVPGPFPASICVGQNMRLIDTDSIVCAEVECAVYECCEDVPDQFDPRLSSSSPSPGQSPSPSPSPSPTPSEALIADTGVEIQAGMTMQFPCDDVNDVRFMERAIAQNLRDQNIQVQDDAVTVTSLICDNRQLFTRRRLNGEVAVEYLITLDSEAAADAGITTAADVQTLVAATEAVAQTEGTTADNFKQALVDYLLEEEGITLTVEDFIVNSVEVEDTTSYQKTSSGDDSGDSVQGWAVALIVVACIAAVIVIVSAVFFVNKSGASDYDVHDGGTIVTYHDEDEKTFATTSAPHSL